MSKGSRRLSRRDFISAASQLALFSGATTEILRPEVSEGQNFESSNTVSSGLPILQGVTTDSTTQISVLAPKGADFKYELIEKERGFSFLPSAKRDESRFHNSWMASCVAFENLELGKSYTFKITTSSGATIDSRTLQTLDCNKKNPRVALISCAKESVSGQEEMWQSVLDLTPDIQFFLGDNTYGNRDGIPGPELLWERYNSTRKLLRVYRSQRLIPTIAIWDDHDFGTNNGNKFYEHKEDSLATFKAMYGQESVGDIFQKGPGVSSSFRAFGQNFLFLDGRYFRDIAETRNGSPWGREQEEWLFDQLKNSSNPNWIINGSQFFGAYAAGESIEKSFPQALGRLNNEMKQNNVISLYCSGDKHFSEVMDIESSILGHKTVELTSSAIHSVIRPKFEKNQRRRHSAHSKNFLICDILSSNGKSLEMKVTSCGKKKKINFQTNVTIKI